VCRGAPHSDVALKLPIHREEPIDVASHADQYVPATLGPVERGLRPERVVVKLDGCSPPLVRQHGHELAATRQAAADLDALVCAEALDKHSTVFDEYGVPSVRRGGAIASSGRTASTPHAMARSPRRVCTAFTSLLS